MKEHLRRAFTLGQYSFWSNGSPDLHRAPALPPSLTPVYNHQGVNLRITIGRIVLSPAEAIIFSPFRLLAITRKELRHITRNFRTFFLVALSPACLLVVLSYLFAVDFRDFKIILLDWDRSPSSRALWQSLTSNGTFIPAQTAEPITDYESAERAIVAGQADLLLVVPTGFEEDLLAGREATVQAVLDGSDSLSASASLSNLQARVSTFGASLARASLPVETRTRAWYNGSLSSLWSMVPGLMAIALCLPVMAFTMGVKREEEVGTFEALIASPVTGTEYQLGKVLAYVLTGLVSVSLATAAAVFWFKIPLRGSFFTLIVMAVEFFLACMGISLLVIRFVPSQQAALFVTLLFFVIPGFFISGLILPVNTSSLRVMLISYSSPVTHFLAASRAIFLRGAGLGELQFQIRALAILAGLTLGLSLLLFRKRLR